MKKILKLFLLNTLILLFSCFIISENIYMAKAYDSIDSTKKTTWTIKEEEISNKYGVYYSHMVGNAKTNNNVSNEKNVNYFSMKTDGENSKLVTWAISYSTQFVTARLSTIAKDYEANHPGWIVVAGINADQWYYSATESTAKAGYFYYYNQSYYPFTMDYQNLFTINSFGQSGNGIAITNNSSKPFLDIYDSSTIQLQIYDENDSLIATYPVQGYNEASSGTAITVWSGYYSAQAKDVYVNRDVISNHNLYVVEKANLAFMNNTKDYPSAGVYHPTDSFYGRGNISMVTNATTLTKGQFAIDTTNQEVIDKLAIGTKVIVEQQYDGISQNIESATGYHTIQVKDGVYQDSNATYNTSTRPRSFFGIKEDGTYFLMTTRDNDPNTGGGTVHTEHNAILSYYNAYTCYQDDGGGSATAIYRNDQGEFDVVSTSADPGKTERNVFSGLFFVVRDPGFTAEARFATPESITLTPNDFGKNITEAMFTINGKTYTTTNEELTIHGLKENESYEIDVKYIYNGIEYHSKIYTKTRKYEDGLNFIATHNGFEIVKYDNYENLQTQNVCIYINEETYEMGNENKFVIDNLTKNCSYVVYYTYDIYNNITQETTHKQSEELMLYTLEKEPPQIVKFEEYSSTSSSVRITYKVTNNDNFEIYIYIKTNDTIEELDKLNGIINNTDLKLQSQIYTYQLIVTYVTDLGITITLESDVLEYGQLCTHNFANATCDAPSTCTICGKTEGSALGHNFTNATCEAPSTCIVCGKTEGMALGHSWHAATCEAPSTCTVCGKTEGMALGHSFTDATCEVPSTCTVCGKTKGSLKDHKFSEATKEKPATCTVCGKTEGEPLKGCSCFNATNLIQIIFMSTSFVIICLKRKK